MIATYCPGLVKSFFFLFLVFSRDVHDWYVRSSKLSCLYTLLCYIYHLRTSDLQTKVGDTSGVIFHRYDGIFLWFIIETLFLIKRTPKNGEKGPFHGFPHSGTSGKRPPKISKCTSLFREEVPRHLLLIRDCLHAVCICEVPRCHL